MELTANLKQGETLGDRVMKVNHAGEHGAVNIYRGQIFIAKWRAPELVDELSSFMSHELRHRSIFLSELERRDKPRCRSYTLCGVGGYILGVLTGLFGHAAIAGTTVAVERVVLKHLHVQINGLTPFDKQAVAAIQLIIDDEQEHHDQADSDISGTELWARILMPIVSISTEFVIWLGMRL